MTRLTPLLASAALLPALIFPPVASVSAQVPNGAERHESGRPEGADRRPHGPGDAGREMRREKRVDAPERRAGAAGTHDRQPMADQRPGPGDRRREPGHDDRPRRDPLPNERPGPAAQDQRPHPRDLGPRDFGQRDPGQRDLAPRGGRPDDIGPNGRRPLPGQGERHAEPRAAQQQRTPNPNGPDARPDRLDEPGRTNRDRMGADRGRRDDRQGRDRPPGDGPAPDRRPNPAGIAVGVGAAAVGAGLAGGFLAPTGARRLDDIRHDRRESREGDETFIREPGRTIVEQGGRSFIVHDESDRFRALGLDVRRERRGNTFVDTFARGDGTEIITTTDVAGRLLRRVRRTRDGREFVLIDNGSAGHLVRYGDDVIVLPPPAVRLPRDRYIVDYREADEGLLYETLVAPPLVMPPQLYTLDEIRFSPDVRSYVRAVDVSTINFETGSWDVPASATRELVHLGTAIKRVVERDPNAVFLVEGYTDATGNPTDNLSLSDRRAQSVAEILTKDFGVPPENLTTQGYGQQNPIDPTPGPSAANRRVVVQNITALLARGR